jgi:hypothetical protein
LDENFVWLITTFDEVPLPSTPTYATRVTHMFANIVLT